MKQSTILTIPKRIAGRGDLVVLPRKDFEALVRASKKSSPSKKLDHDLKLALEDVKAGRISGPFKNVKSLMKSLADGK